MRKPVLRQLSVRMPKSTLDKAMRKSRRQGMTVSKVVREFLAGYAEGTHAVITLRK